MSDTEGTFRITYFDRDTGEDVSLDFGIVTQINSSANKALSTIPLVSMGADRAFQLETGNTLTYTISFKRKSPDDYDNDSEDTTKWSNAHWYYAVNALADRWQMRTNGYRMTFKPSVTNPYAPQIDVNGYIKMLSRRYNTGSTERIGWTSQVMCFRHITIQQICLNNRILSILTSRMCLIVMGNQSCLQRHGRVRENMRDGHSISVMMCLRSHSEHSITLLN